MNAAETNKASKSSKPARKPARKPAKKGKLQRGDLIRAGAFFALAICGLGVSLPHLADEVGMLTGSAALASWLIALTIDCGMVCCKAHLSAKGPSRGVCWAVLGSCTLVSIILNCHAFYAHAEQGFGQVAAIGFGTFLPLFVLALSYVGSEILLGHRD